MVVGPDDSFILWERLCDRGNEVDSASSLHPSLSRSPFFVPDVRSINEFLRRKLDSVSR